ncbi:IclR helix-turn-helix domain-containing protein [Bradyrhizobium brasilense]|uniref:IclR helix-turn-helix domain-containing protein n=1 Tax=Bradyrhizobium brasilense TaxID=1419277 RepID=A0A1G6IGZ7_9BRAD|nr:helix-turn-helix domain-containing protein [Bradyrhizobium brasilense]SDC05741.1 IclR helix-turn-helix domain-containing protein [Bradyrhizobium brasilense]
MPQQPPKLYYIARLWIELSQQLERTMIPSTRARPSARSGLVQVGTAVFIGTVEDRPMTATNVADYIGIPRSTVIRHLRTLRRDGRVQEIGGALYRTSSRQLERMLRQDHRTAVKLVRSTSERLSRS